MSSRIEAPDYLPRLGAGRHHSPRRGACFMEFASYLAGEKWSDHPACTEPVLAALARAVNDLVDDGRRQELLGDVPRVIGLHGTPAASMLVAASAAASAIRVVSMGRQHALAVGLDAAIAALDANGVAAPELRARVAEALAGVPEAVEWARKYRDFSVRLNRRRYQSAGLEVVRIAAIGIADACVFDGDDRLIAMLREAIVALEAERPLSEAVEPAATLLPGAVGVPGSAEALPQPASTFAMR